MAETQQQRAVNSHSANADWFAREYNKRAGNPYADCFAYSRLRLEMALAARVPRPAPQARLLDVGCGTGHYMRYYAEAGYRAAGVDGADEMLRLARLNNPGADIRQSSVELLPFDDGIFDLVLCIEVLRYLPDIERCVHEMARVTRSGGLCLATAQPYGNLNGFWLVNRLGGRLGRGRVSPLRQFFVTPRALARTFAAAGFRQVEILPVYTGPINWVERLARPALPGVLRRWERVDRILSRQRWMANWANMLLVSAVR